MKNSPYAHRRPRLCRLVRRSPRNAVQSAAGSPQMKQEVRATSATPVTGCAHATGTSIRQATSVTSTGTSVVSPKGEVGDPGDGREEVPVGLMHASKCPANR